MNFSDKLREATEKNNSLLCVGLDVDLNLAPRCILAESDPIFAFNKAIIDATIDLVCAYKPNIAFYEALGVMGMQALHKIANYVPRHIPVILDAKLGDVGHTANAYAQAIFGVWGFDAVTLNPYLGSDSIVPFLQYTHKAVFILTRTSNPGSADFQDLICDGKPLYQKVVQKAQEWSGTGNCGLVVGGTRPETIREIRSMAPNMIFLVPGIGAQGGDIRATVQHGSTAEGIGPIISSSRSIIYSSQGKDFAEAARKAAEQLRKSINACRRGSPTPEDSPADLEGDDGP